MKGSRADGKSSDRAALREWVSQILSDTTKAQNPRVDLDPPAREMLVAMAQECEALLFDQLARVVDDDWYVTAVASLCGAAERLRWCAWHTFMGDPWPLLVEAGRFIGRARGEIERKRWADRRRTGRPRGSAPTRLRIEREVLANPKASAFELASLTHASDRYVRKVRRAVKK